MQLTDPEDLEERYRWFQFTSELWGRGHWMCGCGNGKRLKIRRLRLVQWTMQARMRQFR